MSRAASRWLFGWTPFILFSLIIVRGAVMPPREVPLFLIRINDKLIHGTEYFLLFLLSGNAFRRSGQAWLMKYPFSLALAYCLTLGASTEILQLFIPDRISDVLDWAVDGLGASTAWAVLFLISWMLKLFRSPRELL